MSSTLGRLRKLFDDPLLIRDGRKLTATPLAESLANRVSPPAADDAERLRRAQADIVITPREAFSGYRSFRSASLYSDRLLCAVDANNEAVGEKLTLEQFSSLPYLATTCERSQTTAEAQLDRLGISRNTEFSTTFGMVPNLLSGSRMIALVHERLALALADQTTLRLIEPPMPLQPIHLLMLWTNSADADFGHGWLRQRILSLVAELDGDLRQEAAGQYPYVLT